MILAAPGDTGYNIMLFLHILFAMAAFAPAFVHPVLSTQTKAMTSEQGRVLGYIAQNSQRIYSIALILAGLLGFGVAGMSDPVYSLGDGWLIASILVWVAMNGVLHAIQIPAEKAWAAGDDSAEQKAQMGGGILTLLLLVMLYLMIFKPGA